MTRNWRLVAQRPRVEPSTLAKKEKIHNDVLLYLKRQLTGVDAETYSQTLGREEAQVGGLHWVSPQEPHRRGEGGIVEPREV